MQRIQDMFINMEEVAEDAYKNTELLLSQYTKVMFRIEKNLVDIDYEMYAEEGKHLKEMLYDLVDFDATAEKRRIQEKLLNNDMNLCLLEIMRDSLIALRDYPKNGQLYYRLLKYRYFEAGNTNEDVMLMLDDMPSTTTEIFFKELFSDLTEKEKKIVSDYFIMGKQVKETAEELGISTRQVSRDKKSALAKMLKRMKAAGYESYAEAAGAFLQESDYIPTQMETQNSIMKKRTGEVRLPSDHKMKK